MNAFDHAPSTPAQRTIIGSGPVSPAMQRPQRTLIGGSAVVSMQPGAQRTLVSAGAMPILSSQKTLIGAAVSTPRPTRPTPMPRVQRTRIGLGMVHPPVSSVAPSLPRAETSDEALAHWTFGNAPTVRRPRAPGYIQLDYQFIAAIAVSVLLTAAIIWQLV